MKGAFWPWKVNSYKDFMDRFPCFTLGKIKRLLAQLRLAGFIVAKAYKNYDPRDRSLWYRITQKTAEHYTSLAEATAMQQKSKADSDTMLIYACALMDLDVTVLKAAMIKILQTSTFFPSVAEIRFTAEAMVNFYNKTTLPTAGEAWEEVQRQVRKIGPYSSQPWEFSCPEVERAAKQFGIMELCCLQENEVNTARAQFMRIYDRQQEKMKMEREIAAISAQCLPL